MIAPVGLSADALIDTCGHEPTRLTLIHRELTEALLAHAQLIFADGGAELYFRDMVQELGRLAPTAAKYWDGLLANGRYAHAQPPPGTPLERTLDVAELTAKWDGIIDAALVEPERAEILGCPAGEISWRPPGSSIEIANHDVGAASETLTELRRLDASRAIRKGETREEVWTQRLEPLVRSARHVHIQDRFIGDCLVRHYARLAGSRRVPSELQETEWLLYSIAHAADRASVSFYTGYDDKIGERPTTSAFRRAVKRVVGPAARVETIQLFLVPQSKWREPHDRHIRADNAGVELSAGFDRLRRPRVSKEFTATYMYGADVEKLNAEEKEVRAARGAAPVIVL